VETTFIKYLVNSKLQKRGWLLRFYKLKLMIMYLRAKTVKTKQTIGIN